MRKTHWRGCRASASNARDAGMAQDMKRWQAPLMASMMAAVLLSGQALAFRPSGWIHGQSPYMYSLISRAWYYANESDTLWCYGFASRQWTRFQRGALAAGWAYFQWPYAYSVSDGTWFYLNESDVLWCYDFDALQWSRLGEGRGDSARKLSISATGSLQNPAWSPDGKRVVFTRFRDGYNLGAADLMIFDLTSGTVRSLVADGGANVNLPGSAWNAVTRKIVFSSARDPHDEVFLIGEGGQAGDEIRITSRSGEAAYEPSLSSNGQWVVFESHPVDVETNGVIMKRRVDGTTSYAPLTSLNDDCRQPNWSPTDSFIVYQRLDGGQWDLWCMTTDGASRWKTTSGPGDKTDASFSPDGRRLVFSSSQGTLTSANLFHVSATGGPPARITFSGGYDGAPSWSPDGQKIVFESYSGADPDSSSGTTIRVISAPNLD